jgi:hypothetical protein
MALVTEVLCGVRLEFDLAVGCSLKIVAAPLVDLASRKFACEEVDRIGRRARSGADDYQPAIDLMNQEVLRYVSDALRLTEDSGAPFRAVPARLAPAIHVLDLSNDE